MKCPTCGTYTFVKETRLKEEGRFRRYECANLHRFTTMETLIRAYTDADVKAQRMENLKRMHALNAERYEAKKLKRRGHQQ